MINVLLLNELKEMVTLSHDAGLGEVDRAEICQESSKLIGRKRKPQSKYSDEDRYTIAKYAKDNDASQATKFFKNKYPTINDSTMRTFVKKYGENVKVGKACGRSPDRKLKTLMRGRPLMVGPIIDEKVRRFIALLYKKGHVSRSIAATTAMVLLSSTDDESVKNVVVRLHGEKVCYRELGFEGEQRLLAKLKYGTVQRKKQVYNNIIASQV